MPEPARGPGPGPVPALAELQRQIRATGLKSTAPRVAVLRCLLQAVSPLSHSDITEALADLGFDRATLYRNLMDLTEAGVVARTDLGDHVWRFELQTKRGSHATAHPHFVCTDCGTVACLPGVSVSIRAPQSVSAPTAIAAHRVQVQLKGVCDRCI